MIRLQTNVSFPYPVSRRVLEECYNFRVSLFSPHREDVFSFIAPLAITHRSISVVPSLVLRLYSVSCFPIRFAHLVEFL